MDTPKSTGKGWDQLENKVDSLVEALFQQEGLSGMTVAVTQKGRLILSKGYGYALVDGTRKFPMKPCSRSKIGSVTKAAITGPAGYELMKAKKIDATSTKLYGPKGFFGGMLDTDIDIGIKKFAPKSAQWKQWYEKITIQHLLDHKAGFTGGDGDEDVPGAASEFKVLEDQVTAEHQHRYFLRTHPLLFEPGTKYSYSNHGFGLWALLIKEMSGKPYANYVRGHYLRPMELHNAVQWQRANPDACDAYGHRFSENQQPEFYQFAESTLGMGLAAGGFMASAQSLVRLTAFLDKKYTTEELDSMGWGGTKNQRGHLRLGHSGSTRGGKAYVVMYSEGYRTNTENLDLSEVHVAVATNIRGDYSLHLQKVAAVAGLENNGRRLVIVALVGTDLQIRIFDASGKKVIDKPENKLIMGKTLTDLKNDLKNDPDKLTGKNEDDTVEAAMSIANYTPGSLSNLASDIAVAVPVSNVPATFDLWKQDTCACSCEYVRRGVPASEYQQVFDEADRSGYRLEWIDGYTDDGKVHFNVIFRTNEPEIDWVSHHNMTAATYQQKCDEYRDGGFSLDHVDSYATGNDICYAAVWTKSGSAVTAYHGKTAEEHQDSFDSLTSKGWRPKVVSVASLDGKLRYTALYTKQSIGNFETRQFLTPDEYQTQYDQNKAGGRRLCYLKSYLHKSKLHFSAIWAEKPEISSIRANHGLPAGQLLTRWEDAMSDGFRTRAITGCEVSGQVQYAVYWTK